MVVGEWESHLPERCSVNQISCYLMNLPTCWVSFWTETISKGNLLINQSFLDSKSIIWLQRYLVTSWTSILLVVSHDQSFLNEISTDILHFHSQRIDGYKGDYDYYEKAKIEKRKNQEKEYEAQLAFRKHVQEFIDKFRYNAKRSS